LGRFGGGFGGAGGASGLQGMMGGILDREGGFEGDLGLYGKYIFNHYLLTFQFVIEIEMFFNEI
jgi:hypothetical protein